MSINGDLIKWATPRQAELINATIEYGNKQRAADALGINIGTVANAIKRVEAKRDAYYAADPAVREAADAGSVQDVSQLSHFWKIVKDENGNGFSLFVKNPKTGKDISLADMVRDAISEIHIAKPLKLPKRSAATGENLLVIDLADVHFLKLAVKTETGYEYNREVARHRVVEGTKALLRKAAPMGIGRILFVLGNDILHVDNPRSTTTSGTFQDTDGTLFQGYNDAAVAITEAIMACAEIAPVDLIHCMSNHDWAMGWALSQTVAAPFRHADGVINATDYNLSESHRKYYRFGNNLLGFTHGDGAKEDKLYSLMVDEARHHIAECRNLYWYMHHVHHKERKLRGQFPYVKEKDHIGMTAIYSGQAMIEGTHLNIEYVRSPSAPDGWHDRNGYVNRQAVEAFVHHPFDGQNLRITEWF